MFLFPVDAFYVAKFYVGCISGAFSERLFSAINYLVLSRCF